MKPINYFLLSVVLFSCADRQTASYNTSKAPTFSSPGPPTMVYKTRKDYTAFVPVLLSEDKSSIVSYPDPRDITPERKPILLNDGYLFDQNGIGVSVAFLNYTYEEYAQLLSAPTQSELMGAILDDDPLTSLCNCGPRTRFQDPESDLNKLIEGGKLLTECKVLK